LDECGDANDGGARVADFTLRMMDEAGRDAARAGRIQKTSANSHLHSRPLLHRADGSAGIPHRQTPAFAPHRTFHFPPAVIRTDLSRHSWIHGEILHAEPRKVGCINHGAVKDAARVMDSYSVRLHEFIPHDDVQAAQSDLAKKLGVTVEKLQARVIFESAAEVQKKGVKVKPEVMIPLVGFKKKLDLQVAIVHRVAAEMQKEKR